MFPTRSRLGFSLWGGNLPYPKGKYTGANHPSYGKRYVCASKVNPQLAELTPEQVAWVAGIIEGEGSFIAEKRRNGRYATRVYASARIQVQMTDEDVIIRLQELMGGTVHSYPDKRPQCKDQFRWTFRGYENVVAALELLRPWMFSRRTEQMDRMMATVDEVRSEVAAHGPAQDEAT